ncbi:MAG: hypothetical protein ACYDG5_02825 [Dehalococcoidales bacterium]
MNKTAPFSNDFLKSNYDKNLGRLEVTLRSLEVKIRIFLLINEKREKEAIIFLKNSRKLKIGKEVENNWFTKLSHFSELVKEYNRIVSLSNVYCGCKINNKLISLRNALAHGRAFYSEISPPYKTMLLLQFSYPERNTPIVQFHEKMTPSWFDKKIKWTSKEDQKVAQACWIIEKLKPD